MARRARDVSYSDVATDEIPSANMYAGEQVENNGKSDSAASETDAGEVDIGVTNGSYESELAPERYIPPDIAVSPKAAAFSRLASARTSRALDAMRQLMNLANTAQYHFTQEQAGKIIGALAEANQLLMEKFREALQPKEARRRGAGKIHFEV